MSVKPNIAGGFLICVFGCCGLLYEELSYVAVDELKEYNIGIFPLRLRL